MKSALQVSRPSAIAIGGGQQAPCLGVPEGQQSNLGQEGGLRQVSRIHQGQTQPSEGLMEGLGVMGEADTEELGPGIQVRGLIGGDRGQKDCRLGAGALSSTLTPHLSVTIILWEHHDTKALSSESFHVEPGSETR